MYLPFLLLMASHVVAPDAAVSVPSRQPQLAAAHGQVAMVFGAGPGLYFSASPDGGASFAAPVKIADAGVLALGRHRGPRVVHLKDSIVVSAVAGEKKSSGRHAHGLPDDGNLTVWRSVDRGKTWTRSAVVNDAPTAAREGLHAMTAGPNGELFAAWLDLRGKGTQLYGSRSTDGGVTWSKNAVIYSSPEGTICQCCDPSLAIDERGRVYAMWRNALDGSRDLYVATSVDGVRFEAARKIGTGTWKLNACPMDGGGLVVDGGEVISAWRRDGDVYVAEPGQPEKKVGTGKDVAIARSKKGTFVAWTNGGAVELAGPGDGAPIVLTPEGGFVNLSALPDGGVLAAWEAHGSIETKIVR